MKEFFTFLFYFTLLLLFVYKNRIFKLESFNKREILGLFILKIIAGLAYVLISSKLIKAGDIFLYFEDGKLIYAELLQGNVYDYLFLCFAPNGYASAGNIAKVIEEMGFWWDTSAYMIVRLNAIFNLFSFGSIYTNALFFSFLSFCGSLIMVRIIQIVLKPKAKWVLWTVFLSPSLLYWTSGMHKESICIFLIASLLLSFIKILRTKLWYFYILFILSAILLWFTRFFILALLVPPLISYSVWYWKKFNRPILVFAGVYFFLISLLFILPELFGLPSLNEQIIAKKELYEALGKGNTAIELGTYTESPIGIFKKLPQAFFNSLIRPHFMDVNSLFLALASIESFIISLAFLISFFYLKLLSKPKRAFIYLLMAFSLSYLLLTGLIVPNIGAILRYRSVALFLLIPALAYVLSKKDSLAN